MEAVLAKRFTKIRETKYTKNRDATARLREKAIYERYFLKGEHLEKLAKDLGYKSLSSIEKAVVRVRNAYNLPVKRKFIGEAMEDEIVAYNHSNNEIFLFKTAKQIKELGFNYAMAKHSLINQTFTKVRFGERRKNSIKWFFVLAKDYQTRTDDDLKIKREIAKIKMRNCF